MDKKEITYKVPERLYDISVRQYQEYLKVLEKHKDDDDQELLNLKSIEVFCNIPLKEVKKLPMHSVELILTSIAHCLNEDTPLIRTFKMVGTDGVEVEFGFEPELDKIAYGAYQDAEKYLYGTENLHRLMAVLYRPILTGYKDKYLIEEYKGSDHLAEIMKDAPVAVALGMQVFFWNLGIRLSKYTMDYMAEEISKRIASGGEQRLEESGELINRYLHLHKTMSGELTRLQNFHYTPA